jgi:hypothetical protein
MTHCWLAGVGLLTVIASVACAEATQGPEAESSSDNAQAGSLSDHAGAAGNPFQPSAGTSARGGMSGAAVSAHAGSNFGGTSGVAGASFSGAGGQSANTASVAGAASGGAFGENGGSPSVGGSSIGAGAVSGSSAAGSSAGAPCAPRTFSYPDAGRVLTSVGVSGSFNAWAKVGVPLTYDATEQSWQVAMTLDAGTYQYKFVVNGTTWQADPSNSNSVGDGYGGVNSVIVCP